MSYLHPSQASTASTLKTRITSGERDCKTSLQMSRAPCVPLASPATWERRFIPWFNHRGFRARISVKKLRSFFLPFELS